MRFKDKRRRHEHFWATITFTSGEQFARKYLDRERAKRFTARMIKSPVVAAARVTKAA
jgi:hypothetical protein